MRVATRICRASPETWQTLGRRHKQTLNERKIARLPGKTLIEFDLRLSLGREIPLQVVASQPVIVCRLSAAIFRQCQPSRTCRTLGYAGGHSTACRSGYFQDYLNVPVDFEFAAFRDLYQLAYDQGLKGCTTFRPNAVTGAILRGIEEGQAAAHCCSVEREAD